MPRFALPLFVSLVGLVLPAMAAGYTLIQERESRTLELLVALPVRVGQIVLAKLAAIVALAAGATLTLFTIDAAVVLARGIGSVAWVLGLLLVLLSALTFSTSAALLISLLAKDYRSSQNLTGAVVAPCVFLNIAVGVFVPGATLRLVVIAVFYAAGAAAALAVALRVVTFERLLR
ncbi:MAG TPA: ABC transporter permease subunit [Myxococcota bacterium]|nr:ABC transporter permease subunit [Myxococcota bacterium]